MKINGPLLEPKTAQKKYPFKWTPSLAAECIQAIVSYLHTVFKKGPLLHLATRELCNYIYEQTPNYQFKVYGGNNCRWGSQAQAPTGQTKPVGTREICDIGV